MNKNYQNDKKRYAFYIKRKKERTLLKQVIISLSITIFLLFLLKEMVIVKIHNTTNTMAPLLPVDKKFYLNKLAYGWQKPCYFGLKNRYFVYKQAKRGDIVAIAHPNINSTTMFKELLRLPVFIASLGFIELYPKKVTLARVVALPGERIFINAQKIFINKVEFKPSQWKYFHSHNKILSTEYGNYRDFLPTMFVPENSVFVLNDNWDIPTDSRKFGIIHLDKVEGRVLYSNAKKK